MRKIVATLLVLAATLTLFNCKSDPKALEQAKQEGYDSAMRYIQDSLQRVKQTAANYTLLQEKLLAPSAIKHLPPYDGHVHDNGYQLLQADSEYASGVMARVIDSAHNEVVARLPFIIKKGKLKAGDDYMSDKKRHPHFDNKDIELIRIPVVDPTTGMPDGTYTVLAIVKEIVPKSVPHTH